MMRAYELMVIIDSDLEDAKAQAWVKVVTDGIIAAGGTIHGRPDWWGKRHSPIRSTARRRLLPGGRDRCTGRLARRAGARLRLADEVVRFKLLKLPDTEADAPRHDGRRRLTPAPDIGRSTPMADNTVTLVGNVTRDPELRFTSGGRGVASFGLAVNRRYQSTANGRNRRRSSTSWRGARSARTSPPRSTRARAPSSTAASSSARGRPRTARSAPRSRSSPTRSGPACAGRRPRSSGPPAPGGRRPAVRRRAGARRRRRRPRPRSDLRRRRAVLRIPPSSIRQEPTDGEQEEPGAGLQGHRAPQVQEEDQPAGHREGRRTSTTRTSTCSPGS